MSREGDSLQNMANLMGKLTGKIVVIQDKRLEIQAIAYPAGAITLDEEALQNALIDKDNLPAVLRNRKAAAKANRTYWQQLLFPHHNVARLISPIISGDRARGYLSIIGSAGEIDLLDTTAVEQGAAACALEMAKAKAVSEAKKALRGNFLEGLLAGTIPEREVERLAARLDHDTEQPHAALTFRWRNGTGVSVRRIETTLNWLLSTHTGPTLVHIYGDSHIVAFCALQDTEESGQATRLARRLRDQLEADYPQEKLSAGLSGILTTLTQWPQGYQDALQAMEVGERLNLLDVVEFNSLGIYRLLGQLDDVAAVREFCDDVIGPLVRYDRDHRSSLVLTIEQYFNHHGNVSQTAESLFIHRNTLLYRLDRIQDLTGHDLDQSDMRLALHLALKLWQLRPENS
jgi:purine catabolism regulator